MEHEQGLLFHEGKFTQVLGPGKHVRWGRDYSVERYDIRVAQMAVAHQEITCADGVSIRANARGEYRIVDVEKAYRSSAQIYSMIYDALHEGLREVLGQISVDEALATKVALSQQLTDLARAKVSPMGVEFLSCAVRDLAVSGEIKRAYGQLLVAQKDAQAALERARGETAAMRSLANAARLMDANPNLLQLRWIHALNQTKGATIVLSPSGMIPTAPSTQESE